MTKSEKQIILYNKIVEGLELSYKKLLEFKKEKKSELVVLRNGKIQKIKP